MEIVELCGIFMCWVVSVQSNRVRVRLMPLPQSVSFVYTIFPNDFREAVFVCLTSIGTALSQSDPLPLKIILLGVRLQDSLATQDSPGGRHFPPHSTPSESPWFKDICISMLVSLLSKLRFPKPAQMPRGLWSTQDLHDRISGGLGSAIILTLNQTSSTSPCKLTSEYWCLLVATILHVEVKCPYNQATKRTAMKAMRNLWSYYQA